MKLKDANENADKKLQKIFRNKLNKLVESDISLVHRGSKTIDNRSIYEIVFKKTNYLYDLPSLDDCMKKYQLVRLNNHSKLYRLLSLNYTSNLPENEHGTALYKYNYYFVPKKCIKDNDSLNICRHVLCCEDLLPVASDLLKNVNINQNKKVNFNQKTTQKNNKQVPDQQVIELKHCFHYLFGLFICCLCIVVIIAIVVLM